MDNQNNESRVFTMKHLYLGALAVVIVILAFVISPILTPMRVATSPLEKANGQWLLLFQHSQQHDYLWLELNQDQTMLEGEGEIYQISIDLVLNEAGQHPAQFGEVGSDDLIDIVLVVADHRAKLMRDSDQIEEIFYLLRVAEYERFPIEIETEKKEG